MTQSPGEPKSVSDIKTTATFEDRSADEWGFAEKHQYDLERQIAQLRRYQQETKQKKKYAGRIFCFLSIWSVLLFTLVFVSGLDNINFRLSDKVLIALISGTTVNVIGLFLVVANYLFPKNYMDP